MKTISTFVWYEKRVWKMVNGYRQVYYYCGDTDFHIWRH